MVVEIRDWCQNVGEYNTYNFCIWHFGLCVIVSKIDRCRSSDPPYEIVINPWWRGGRGLPSLIALFVLYLTTINNASLSHNSKHVRLLQERTLNNPDSPRLRRRPPPVKVAISHGDSRDSLSNPEPPSTNCFMHNI